MKAKKSASDRLLNEYATSVAAKTDGSYRIRRANREGINAARLLGKIVGTPAEEFIVGYLDRARQRLVMAKKHARKKLNEDERADLVSLLLEHEALSTLLNLDQMHTLRALRLRRCLRCESWFWGRVEAQRYCSENCRVRHYQTSADGKKYKREWARKNYQRNKILDEQALRYVQRPEQALRYVQRPNAPPVLTS